MRLFNIAILTFIVTANSGFATELQPGSFDAELVTPGGPIRFELQLGYDDGDTWTASIRNPLEHVRIPSITVQDDSVTLAFPHYDSTIVAKVEGDRLVGKYRKRRGPSKWGEMTFNAKRRQAGQTSRASGPSFDRFVGKWSVKFSKSEDPALGVFSVRKNDKEPWGTFLTTTGDYRFLVRQSCDDNTKVELSVFDGAHAFLFRMQRDTNNKLTGDFWSGNSWHETFSGELDPRAELPDAFRLTTVLKGTQLNDLKYPDLNGKLTSLGNKKFAGKARIIQVFGSWCPNCHDAALYLAELDKKYRDKGLSIVGLAFEHTGELERDAEMVRRYIKRHGTKYPVLLAGLSDKGKATKQFPLIDRVRSYPTTIFLRADGTVRAVYTGFSGPATGKANDKLKTRFEKLIEELLAE